MDASGSLPDRGYYNVKDGECETIPSGCGTDYDPVCTANGVLYPNECELKQSGEKLDVMHRFQLISNRCMPTNIPTNRLEKRAKVY